MKRKGLSIEGKTRGMGEKGNIFCVVSESTVHLPNGLGAANTGNLLLCSFKMEGNMGWEGDKEQK